MRWPSRSSLPSWLRPLRCAGGTPKLGQCCPPCLAQPNCPLQVRLPLPEKLTTRKARAGRAPPLCSSARPGFAPTVILGTLVCLLSNKRALCNLRRQPRAREDRSRFLLWERARPAGRLTADIPLVAQASFLEGSEHFSNGGSYHFPSVSVHNRRLCLSVALSTLRRCADTCVICATVSADVKQRCDPHRLPWDTHLAFTQWFLRTCRRPPGKALSPPRALGTSFRRQLLVALRLSRRHHMGGVMEGTGVEPR